jgi:hypothetical protein
MWKSKKHGMLLGSEKLKPLIISLMPQATQEFSGCFTTDE